MLDYRDLLVSGSSSAWEEALVLLEQRLGKGWSEEKPRVVEPIINSDEVALFFYSDDELREDFEIRVPRKLRTGNVSVHISTRENLDDVSIQTHNSVLKRFLVEHLRPACDEVEIEVHLSSDEKRLSDVVPAELERQLHNYLKIANWGDSGTHPLDEKRWMKFIVNALDCGELDGDMLAQFLSQDYEVPSRWAERCAREFDFGRSLLLFYRYLLEQPDSEPM